MRKNEAIQQLKEVVDIYMSNLMGAPDTEQLTALVLEKALAIGMAPPRVSDDDVQAIMQVYYGGYTTHQWDEDLEKDEQVMEAKRKRAEYKALSGPERVARRQEALAKLNASRGKPNE